MASRYSCCVRTVATARESTIECVTKKRIFLLDGHSLSYRAFFALPTSLTTSSGQVTNAAYGFTSMLIKLLTEEKPDRIAVAFDKGAPTVRLEKYAEYKAGRGGTAPALREAARPVRRGGAARGR